MVKYGNKPIIMIQSLQILVVMLISKVFFHTPFDFGFRWTQKLLMIPLNFNFNNRGYDPRAEIKLFADSH